MGPTERPRRSTGVHSIPSRADVRAHRRRRPGRVRRGARRAGGGPRGLRPRRGPALARAPRRGRRRHVGGSRRPFHGRDGAGDGRPAGGGHRARRVLRRRHRRGQHEHRHRPDRPAALRGGSRAVPRHGPGARRVVRRAGDGDDLADAGRHRHVPPGPGPRELMYVLIVGGGKVGWNLARELIDKGEEVTLIESDRRRYLVIEQELEHAVQYGDATELWVLERAGIQRADLVIAVTGDDEDNMLVCQVAKEKYLVERIIARVNNPRNLQHFKLLGIQPAVSATDLILRLIEHEVPRYGLVHLLALEEERLEIIELEVGDGAPAAGQKVAEVDLPEGALIISVLRDGGGFVPKADTVIEAGDEVLLVLDPGLEENVTPQFTNRS